MELGNEVQATTAPQVATVDNFSRLPDYIIHHIYSFLPGRDVACTSILSKAWYRIWVLYSCVVLHFIYTKSAREEEEEILDQELPGPMFGNYRKQDFLFTLGNSIRERLRHEFYVHRFELYIDFPNLDMLAPTLNQCIRLAIERNVAQLALCIDSLSGYFRSHYRIPQFVVLASSLKVLSLSGCKFEGGLNIELPRLQKLSLCHSCFADMAVFERFLCGCPVIEYLKISFCNLMGELLSIPNLPELKYFECLNCDMVEIIRICAANLHTFSVGTSKGYWPRNIDLARCSTALKEFHINGYGSAHVDGFVTVISQLLVLEILEFHGCISFRSFNISNQSLKRLAFRDCSKLSVGQVDTPNLQLFEHINCDEPFLPISASDQLQIHFSFVFRGHSVEWLLKLKDFLLKLKYWEDVELIYPEDQKKITDELPIKNMTINEKLSQFVLEKLKELSSIPNQLISCEVDTPEANRMDPAREAFIAKHSSGSHETFRVTFKWKYDASQSRFIF